jgi:hypothetical protein
MSRHHKRQDGDYARDVIDELQTRIERLAEALDQL